MTGVIIALLVAAVVVLAAFVWTLWDELDRLKRRFDLEPLIRWEMIITLMQRVDALEKSERLR